MALTGAIGLSTRIAVLTNAHPVRAMPIRGRNVEHSCVAVMELGMLFLMMGGSEYPWSDLPR